MKMPKYYRYRSTTPSRKSKKNKEKEKDREVERIKEPDCNWLDLTLSCSPAPSWYLRRISWRETPPLLGVPRELAATLRNSLSLAIDQYSLSKIQQRYILKL